MGDTGTIEAAGGTFVVEDTLRPIEGLVLHRGRFERGSFAVGDAVTLTVDAERRNRTRRNHSATHLLHFALRAVLGDHVRQRGSQVGPSRLRFDFSHFGPLTGDETRRIERLVNERVVRNEPARTDVLTKDEATARGAIAFFEDKYGETVRMLTITDDSIELCGGTHVHATGDIGLFKIVSESGLAAGVRRVEAVTGLDALEWAWAQERWADEVSTALGSTPAEAVAKVQRLLADGEELSKRLRAIDAKERAKGVADAAPEALANGITVLVLSVDGVAGADLRDMADKARQRLGSGVVLLSGRVDDKAAILVAVTADLVGRIHAGNLVKDLATLVGGKGGGRPDLAQAGGPDTTKLPEVAARFRALLSS